MRAVEKARAMQAVTIVKAIGDAQEVYYLANGAYADNLDDLGIEVPGTDYNYVLKRKKLGVFDSGAKVISSFDDSVAVSNRWENAESIGQSDAKAYYYFVRFTHDNNLYCIQGSLQDPYHVCKTLSGGSSTTKNRHTLYIVR